MECELNQKRKVCDQDNGPVVWARTLLATEMYPVVTNRHTRFDTPDYNLALADLKD